MPFFDGRMHLLFSPCEKECRRILETPRDAIARNPWIVDGVPRVRSNRVRNGVISNSFPRCFRSFLTLEAVRIILDETLAKRRMLQLKGFSVVLYTYGSCIFVGESYRLVAVSTAKALPVSRTLFDSWHVMHFLQIARLYYGIMGAEGNMKKFVDALQGEAMLSTYATLRALSGIPNLVRPLLSWVLRVVLGNYRQSSLLMWVLKSSTEPFRFVRRQLCVLSLSRRTGCLFVTEELPPVLMLRVCVTLDKRLI